jgi:hypothetical protein
MRSTRDKERSTMSHVPRLALAVALVGGLATGAVAQAGLGQPAPDWTFTGNDGMSYTLSDGFGSHVQLLHMIGYA